MLDNLMTLAVAKAKAVGLVAGTAMVTTALVGGGAVAMTVVSNEKAQEASASAAPAVDLQAAGEGEQSRSDTATANIARKGQDRGQGRADDGEGVACGDVVSAVAEAKTDQTSGRDHGAAVSATARDCNGADEPASERGSSEEAKANRPAQAEDQGAQRDAAPRGEQPAEPAQAERGQTESGQAGTRAQRPDDAGPPAEAGSSAGRGGGRG